MPPEIDPTQQGGQQDKPVNPRNAALAQIAQQAREAVAGDMAAFDEGTGEITPNAAAPAETHVAPADDAAVDEQKPEPTEPEPTGPKMLTIVVDGQSIEVEESRILEAGKRTLQKDHAADRRLQEAAHTKRQAEALLAQAQRLSIPDANSNNDPTPSQDASRNHAQATNGLDPAMLDTYLENKLYVRDAQKAAEKFKADFPDIASDPHLMNIAAGMEQQRLETAAALGESMGDPYAAYRKHGEAVQKWLQARSGTPAPTAPVDKTERKRTITAIPAVNARAPVNAAPKTLTTAERIEQMAEQRRNAGRPVPQRSAFR